MEQLYINQLKREDFRTSDPRTIVRWDLNNGNILSASCQWVVPNITIEDFNAITSTRSETLFSPTFSAGKSKELNWDITAEVSRGFCSIKLHIDQMNVKKYDFQVGRLSSFLNTAYLCKFGGNKLNAPNKEYVFSLGQLNHTFLNCKVIVIIEFVAEISIQTISRTLIAVPNINTLESNVQQKDVFQEMPQNKLSQDFELLFEQGYLADVTFIVGDQKVHAHRIVLSARSMVFYNMFNKNNRVQNIEIEITDFSHEVIREMIHFIYSGRLCDRGMENIQELLKVGKRYALESLSALCQDILCEKYLDIANVVTLLNFSNAHSIKSLEDLCKDFIGENVKIFDPAELKMLKPQLLMSILMKVSKYKN